MNIVSAKILKLLKESLGDARHINKFYMGNPRDLASADLPTIFVQPLSKEVEQLDNVNDLVTAEFMVGVAIDPAKYQNKDINEDMATKTLMEIEGGRNSDGTPVEDSVSYVMRNNFYMENTVIFQSHRSVWGEREITGGVAIEVHSYFTVRIKVNNQS
ncbi:MAG: hypothetical protein U9O78_02045 [Patescibacteria group bacterium]|nr:hypothetical protein [Patescibacteria group bacterium]